MILDSPSFSNSNKSCSIIPESINPKMCIKVAENLGFEIFEDRLNLWGIRCPTGEWNDIFIDFWYDKKLQIWNCIRTIGTTEPSANLLQYIFNQGGINKNGLFILKHDEQYKECYIKGLHKGKYPALIQNPNYKFIGYRKKYWDKKKEYYSGQLYNDVKGANYHSTKEKYVYLNKTIGTFSIGCQVQADWNFFKNEHMSLINKFNQKTYDYTLVFYKNFI